MCEIPLWFTALATFGAICAVALPGMWVLYKLFDREEE